MLLWQRRALCHHLVRGTALQPNTSDITLAEKFLRGDAQAFDALVARHKERVYSLIYRMTGDREWAEDITVEVFVEAYQSLPSFRQRASFATWLHRVAVNVCLEHLRSLKAKRQIQEVQLDEADVPSRLSAADVMMTRELADQIVRAMQTLPLAQRAALSLFYLEERTHSEIAEILGIPKNTVKTRIFYGTRALRDQLQAKGIISSPERHRGEV